MSTPPFPLSPLGGPASLVECFAGMKDPRVNRTREHNLIDILAIGFCAILAGGEGFNDMEEFGRAKEEWFRTFLELPNGIPRHDTFNRVFQALDPGAFLECFLRWTEGLRSVVAGEVVAVDGKALRRALDKGKGSAIPYMVSAWASANGLVLGQVKVDEKSNEITAVPELLRALELKGCDVDWFEDRGEWEGLRGFGVVESVRDIGGTVSVERRYHLLSLGPDVLAYARASRSHWGVENNVHWTLDVAFKEDQSRARAGYAAQNLATLRRLALNALKREPSKRSLRLKVKRAGWNNDYLAEVLGIDPA